ncbi:MAG: hypothetical protein OHK0029_41460 [Armatimonadaceae bacterium]
MQGKARTVSDFSDISHFQRILDFMPGIVHVTNVQENANIYINRSIQTLLGYSPAEIQAMGAQLLETLLHPEDLENVLPFLQRCNSLRDEEFADWECRLRHRDGEYRWFRTQERVLRCDENGKIELIIGNATDISSERQQSETLPLMVREAKSTEEVLREELAQVKTVLDHAWKTESVLRTELDRVETAIAGANDGIFNLDLRQNRVVLCHRSCEILGHSSATMPKTARQILKVFDRELRAAHLRIWRQWRRSGTDQVRLETLVRRDDGAKRWVLLRGRIFRDNQGKIERFAGAVTDIEARKAQEQRLQLLEMVVSNCSDAILITEAEPIDQPGPRVIYVNPAFTAMTGYAPEEIIGKNPRILQGPDTDKGTRKRIREKLQNWEPFTEEILNYRKDGKRFWVQISVQPVCNEDGWYTHWVAIQREVTQRRLLEQEREFLLHQALERADRDALTNLLNHRAMQDNLREVAARCQRLKLPLTVAMFDVDNFKLFNEAYGHQTGDRALQTVAKAIHSFTIPGSITGRLGGDEFAIFLPNLNYIDSQRVLTQFLQEVEEAGFTPPGASTPVPITMTFGLATYPEDTNNPADLLTIADERLRLAKQGSESSMIKPSTELCRELLQSVEGFTMLDALISAIDNKDRYTRRHSYEVMTYARAIGEEMGLEPDYLRTLQVSALLHDVGKICVPDRILRFPGPLGPSEVQALRMHPEFGAMLVQTVPALTQTCEVPDGVLFHHERWDGTGYPERLCETEIPLIARIIAVGDAFSAMTSDRPYRRGKTEEEALQVIREESGRQFDPECATAFLNWQAHRRNRRRKRTSAKA